MVLQFLALTVDDAIILCRTSFCRHGDPVDPCHPCRSVIDHILHAQLHRLICLSGDLRYFMLHLESSQDGILRPLPIDALHKMRRVKVSLVGDDAHQIGHLQGSGRHLTLTDPQKYIITRIPDTPVHPVIEPGIRNESLVLTRQIKPEPNTHSKGIGVLLPANIPIEDTVVLTLINRHPVDMTEIGITGIRQGVAQIRGMTTAGVGTTDRTTAGHIGPSASITIFRCDDPLIQCDQCPHRLHR